MRISTILLALVIFVAFLGVPIMASADGGDTSLVHACLNPSGLTRIITPDGSCSSSETPVHWSSTSPRTVPATFTVDCDVGETINAKLKDLIPGDTPLVSGTCNENVVMQAEVHRITLDGQGTATINGGPPTTTGPSTIRTEGRGITIKGFTITGGRDGINVNWGGTATLDGNFIQNTGRTGVNVNNGSVARVINNTIQNNPSGGILVNGSSTADIGFTGPIEARVPGPNIVQNNGRGISVQRSSMAQIGYSTITNNTGRGIQVGDNSHAEIGGLSDTGPSGNTIQGNGSDGVRVNRVSHADISGNTINSNGGDGIRVEENSGVNLNEANTTTVNNGGIGLRCLIGAYARGSLETLNGNAGQTSFDATCINATSP